MFRTFLIYFAIMAATFVGVEIFRRWSLKRRLLDIPNERSSHSIPTPRGGGVIIFAVSLLSYLLYNFTAGGVIYWSYISGALIIAFISFLDDFREISPVIRILFHSLAAGLIIWFVGGFEIISIPFFGILKVGVLGNILTFFWIVSLITVYNFMDGIDGIAATQAITAGIGWSVIGVIWEIPHAAFYGGILAASSLGFLIHNWEPAKIFMGDVGSAFLGYTFAVLPLFLVKEVKNVENTSYLPWLAVFFVWLFVFDMAFTFIKRYFRIGWRAWEPHREHIYQKIVDMGISHSFVTLLYGIVSAVMITVVILALKNSTNISLAVIIAIFIATALLLMVWQILVRTFGKNGGVI